MFITYSYRASEFPIKAYELAMEIGVKFWNKIRIFLIEKVFHAQPDLRI